MAYSRSQWTHRLEKRINGYGASDWSPDEQRILQYLVTLSGIPAKRWCPYPYVLGDKVRDEPSRRSPSYCLWYRWRDLSAYLAGGIAHIDTHIQVHVEQGGNPDALTSEQILIWKQEYEGTDPARHLLTDALAALYDHDGAAIASRRGGIPWHELPRAIYTIPRGYSWRWASVQLASILYSPYRHDWDLAKVQLRPNWPCAWDYKRNI